MTAEDRREDPAEALARKMREADQFSILWDEGDPWPKPEGLLPYARALIRAEKALGDAARRLRLAAGCIENDDARNAAHVNADGAHAAYAALLAVIEP